MQNSRYSPGLFFSCRGRGTFMEKRLASMGGSSQDDHSRNSCSSWKRSRHKALLAALGIWTFLMFFTVQQQQCGQFRYEFVVRSHQSNFERLNLIGRKVIAQEHSQIVELVRSVTKENIKCDFSHFRTDICDLQGDVRVKGEAATVALLAESSEEDRVVAKIKPYTRKWEASCMKTIGEISVESLSRSSSIKATNLSCDVHHSVPAIVFSTGGYTGNVYHEFNDGLIPLFITSSEFKGEVVFVILELHKWWMTKYGSVVKRLSNYPVVDFDGKHRKQVHCFPKVIVGMKIHDELTIDSSSSPSSPTMREFQELLRNAMNPPEAGELELAPPIQQMIPVNRKIVQPKLVLLTRKGSRVLLNQNAVIKLAKQMGFQVVTLAPDSHTELRKVHEELHSAEVFVGVHGAALTHLLFLRPGSVFIQIVPLGTDWAATTYYGDPAVRAGMKYLEYKIAAEESSLVRRFGRNHTAIAHPEVIASKGWWEMKKIYLQSQDVRISLSRFKPVLQKALRETTQQRFEPAFSLV